MKIYKAKDYADMSRKAANILSAQVIMKPDCVLGLATGSTPIGVYNQLVEWYNKGDIDWESSPLCRQERYCLSSVEKIRQLFLQGHWKDRSHQEYRHLFCSFIMMLQWLQIQQHCHL